MYANDWMCHGSSTFHVACNIITVGGSSTVEHYELTIKQDRGYYFGSKSAAGLSNENDPTASLYSIINTFDADKRSLYQTDNNKYQFRLEYDNSDGSTQSILEWRQTNWLLESHVTGAEFINVPTQSPYSTANCEWFYGLALSPDWTTLIDGNGANGCWLSIYPSVSTPYVFEHYNRITNLHSKQVECGWSHWNSWWCYPSISRTNSTCNEIIYPFRFVFTVRK